jgi:urease accessory protein
MLCEHVIGRVADEDAGVDWVEIDPIQTTRRALRLVSRAGRKINILLPRNTMLRHGDLVSADPRVAIFVRPIDVLVLRPANVQQAARLAAELGNLHVLIEFSDRAILTPNDGPSRQIADELSVSYTIGKRRFHPDPRTSRMTNWNIRTP